MVRRYIRDYDYTLLFLTLALVFFGVVMINSAQPDGPTYDFFAQQLLWAALGLVAMACATLIDYRFLG
ncbi:MAG: rod shape-determining protein RodA, partial [Ardenticatenaceae bacterium]